MSKYMSSRFDTLKAYVPGEQPQDKKYIKLNTNESPYPPSPEVLRAIDGAELEKLRLYCDPEARALKDAIAEKYGVEAENVFVSNGSDETLNFFFTAFCDSGRKAAFPAISYGFYRVFARLHGIDALEVPLGDDFAINAADYENIGANIVIANPNAPTGLALELNDIEKITASNPDYAVAIDEAYVDFGAESAVPLTKKYDNLLVVQTFSKSRSLAGARLGFAIGNAALVSDLEKIKYSTNPYNVNALTQKAGKAAIEDTAYFEKTCGETIKNRAYAIDGLRALGFKVLDSKANFVFAESSKISGAELYRKLKENGILVRHFDDEGIRNFNRITIGTKEQTERLLNTVKKILEVRL